MILLILDSIKPSKSETIKREEDNMSLEDKLLQIFEIFPKENKIKIREMMIENNEDYEKVLDLLSSEKEENIKIKEPVEHTHELETNIEIIDMDNTLIDKKYVEEEEKDREISQMLKETIQE